MDNRIYILCLALVATGLGLAQQPIRKASPAMDAEECAVWQREMTFAKSVENHDAKSFATHLHPGAVFNAATNAPVRGRDAVIKEWEPLVEGKDIKLRWRPEFVSIGGDRNIAISRGPYVLEDARTDAKVRFRAGTFTSVWVKQPESGEWLVLFDGGGPPGTEVKEAQAAQEILLRAPKTCPAKK